MRMYININSFNPFCHGIKITLLLIFLCLNLLENINAQCKTYVQMVSGPEGCVAPQIVSTQELLLPCYAPEGFDQLEVDDFAYIDYTASSCITTCQFSPEVDITCFSLPVGIGDQSPEHGIKIFPTLVSSLMYIEGEDIMHIEVYNEKGVRIMKKKQPGVLSMDLGGLDAGIYFIRIVSKNQISVKKIIKL